MITPFEILNLASILHDGNSDVACINGNPELAYRNCARMAYYSMLHLSKEIVDDEHVDIDCSGIVGTHEIIIQKLLAIDSELSKSLADYLISSRSIRVKADYFINKKFTKQEAYKVLRKAEKAFSKINDNQKVKEN
ncbi:hypothetical protein JZM10_02995 [Providencia rettgeri]|uniref:hypothetical protein n=1 Tax=Providencia TaxID=586 RepID=UPI00197D07CF|nr:hypothetical protein [Providencia rettgeri]ELR5271124.1 hypothetical protein [Providencia rettgeri]MBN6350433.1 hypothetical protein [Providencia rettgeri]MCG9949199.1 hypothetical protein [Providencia rettgeri]HEM6924085.1 hypothetical protein [Providencia rettgeri]